LLLILPHSFIPRLKPSFSANPSPSHRSLSFSSSALTPHGFRGLFTDTSEDIRFLFFSFSVFFLHFLVVGSVQQIKLTRVSF